MRATRAVPKLTQPRFCRFCRFPSSPLASETRAASRWWSHVQYLAGDKLQGRDTGSEGYKLMKVTMSLEVDSPQAQDEILKRQAHVRDVILVLLTSKTYGEVSGENAQQKLKDEIVDTVNSFLTKGKIKKILFTEFLFN